MSDAVPLPTSNAYTQPTDSESAGATALPPPPPPQQQHLQSPPPPQQHQAPVDPAAERRAAEAATAVRGDDGRMIIPTKLFVGGLSSAVTDAALKELFSQFGNVVEARVQIDKFTRLSRNFGFIVFEDPASATALLADPRVQQLELEGKKMNVRYAEALGQGGRADQRARGYGAEAPRDAYSRGGYGPPGDYRFAGGDRERDQERRDRDVRHSGGGGPGSGDFKVFVGHLDPSINDADLRAYFERFGPVSEAVIMKEKGTGRSKGYAFLHYVRGDSVEACFAQRDHAINGKPITLERSKSVGGGNSDRDRDYRGPAGPPGGDRYGAPLPYGAPAYGGYGAPAYGAPGGYDDRRDRRDDHYRRDDRRDDPRDRRDDRDRYAPREAGPPAAPYGAAPYHSAAPVDPYGYYAPSPYAPAPYGGGYPGAYGAPSPYAAPVPPPRRPDDRDPRDLDRSSRDRERERGPYAPAPAPYGAPLGAPGYPPAAPYAAVPPAQRGYDAYANGSAAYPPAAGPAAAASAYPAPASAGPPAAGAYPPYADATYGAYPPAQPPAPYR